MAEKGDLAAKGENVLLLQNPRLFFLALLVGLLYVDPFRLGPLADHDYRPVAHDIAPYDEVMARWPDDGDNRLSFGRLEFSDEVFGPESIAFDPSGRGPYTGLADGRVVRWLGEGRGWDTFAVVSGNWNHFVILLEGEATGRLLRYDPLTMKTHVVLYGLAFPNGVQLSNDQTFLLFTETTNCRVMRYWLEGPKGGQLEVFAHLPGFPDNVRMNEKGQFWVAIDCCRTRGQQFLSRNPWLRGIYFKIPMKLEFLARRIGATMYTVVALFDEAGGVVDVLQDREGRVMRLVSEVREVEGKLWIGTVAHNHIATLPYNS